MAFARKYEYFEVRHMLQAAEGVDSPVTQKPAHSRVLHAMGGAAPVAEWDLTDMPGRTVVAWSTD